MCRKLKVGGERLAIYPNAHPLIRQHVLYWRMVFAVKRLHRIGKHPEAFVTEACFLRRYPIA